MNTDSYFWMGSRHNICEDYATSGTVDDIHYAIISDGCSGSDDTDFGSRLLTRSAVAEIKNIESNNFHTAVIEQANLHRTAIGLEEYALDATLLVIAIINDRLILKMFGDGFAYIKYKNDCIIFNSEYKSGAPYYLNYLINDFRNEKFKEVYTTKCTVTKMIESEGDGIITTINNWVQESLPVKDLVFAAVVSDGIHSYEQLRKYETSIQTESILFYDVYEKLLAFKGFAGEFVKRRAIRSIKEFSAENITNTDDVSVGVVYGGD